MPQRTCSKSSNQFKAVNVDAIAIAIATQLTISSEISKNCNCLQSIATAIKLLRALHMDPERNARTSSFALLQIERLVNLLRFILEKHKRIWYLKSHFFQFTVSILSFYNLPDTIYPAKFTISYTVRLFPPVHSRKQKCAIPRLKIFSIISILHFSGRDWIAIATGPHMPSTGRFWDLLTYFIATIEVGNAVRAHCYSIASYPYTFCSVLDT